MISFPPNNIVFILEDLLICSDLQMLIWEFFVFMNEYKTASETISLTVFLFVNNYTLFSNPNSSIKLWMFSEKLFIGKSMVFP